MVTPLERRMYGKAGRPPENIKPVLITESDEPEQPVDYPEHDEFHQRRIKALNNENKALRIMLAILVLILAVFVSVFASEAVADRVDNSITNNLQEYPVINNYATELTEITQLLEDHYPANDCQGVAISQAGANNTMYFGTSHFQLSLGAGECDGELASSLMGGMRINNNLMINGSWAADENVNAFGFGATVIFK